MGQKANTLTIRKNKNNLKSFTLNTKEFLNFNEYIDVLKRSLEKKGVIITSYFFETNSSTFNLSLNLFFKTQKLLKYKKILEDKEINTKIIKHKKKNFCLSTKKNLKKIQISKNRIKSIKTLKNLTTNLPTNSLLVNNFRLLNREVSRKVTILIHLKLNYFKKMLFSRRFNLYFDFLKLTALLITKKININIYNVILGTIFKFLTKKSHNKFFTFLKKLAHVLIKSSTIDGIKIGINGKLKGKLRAKPFKMAIGKMGTQTITSELDFSKVHIHTLYGCFGLKTWIKYTNKK